MTQQIEKTHLWAERIWLDEAFTNGESQPIFFFDGDFRTWGEVSQRAQINMAMAAYLKGWPRRIVV